MTMLHAMFNDRDTTADRQNRTYECGGIYNGCYKIGYVV